MKRTEYYLKARLFPTIICAVPLLTLYYFGFSEKVIDFIEFLKVYKWVSDITFSAAIIYLVTQINRFVSKEMFQNLFFKEEKHMPTTNFLMSSNTSLAQDTKRRIRAKILEKFGIELLSNEEENVNESEARAVIIDAVAQIRNVTRDNQLLLQHNMEYGFTRNLIGGCFIALLVSLFNLYFFHTIVINEQAFSINVVVGVLYLIPLILSRYLINRYGKNYAKVLFEQFLSI